MNKQFLIKAPRTQIVLRASDRYLTECGICNKTVDLVTFAEASEIVGVGVDEIIDRSAAGVLHIAVRPEALLVCLSSLLASDFPKTRETFVYRANQQLIPKLSC